MVVDNLKEFPPYVGPDIRVEGRVVVNDVPPFPSARPVLALLWWVKAEGVLVHTFFQRRLVGWLCILDQVLLFNV